MTKKLLKTLFLGILIGMISLSCEKKDEEDNTPSTTSNTTSSTSSTSTTSSTSNTGTTSTTSTTSSTGTTSTTSTTSSTSSTSSTSTTGSIVTSPGVIPGKDKLVIGKTSVSLTEVSCYTISGGGSTSITFLGSNEGEGTDYTDIGVTIIGTGNISNGNISLSLQNSPYATVSVSTNDKDYSSGYLNSKSVTYSSSGNSKTLSIKSLELSNSTEKIMVDFNFTCVEDEEVMF